MGLPVYRVELGLGMAEFPNAAMSTFCQGDDELWAELKRILPLKEPGPLNQLRIELEEVLDDA